MIPLPIDAHVESIVAAVRAHRAAVVIAMCGNVAGPIGAILAGLFAEWYGLTPVLWVCVAGYALSLPVLLASRIRTLPRCLSQSTTSLTLATAGERGSSAMAGRSIMIMGRPLRRAAPILA